MWAPGVEQALQEPEKTSDTLTAFPVSYVNKVASLSHAERITILKSLSEDRRMILIGQLPADQVEAVMSELF